MADFITLREIANANGWSPVRKHFDVRAFGVNGWTATDAGDQLVGEHDENVSGHEELYLVVTGRATFTVDGEDVDAGAGTVVFVRDPASKRKAVAAEPATTVLSIGGKPGEAYAPRAWETNAEIFPLFAEGRIEEAKEKLEAALDRYDEREVLLYNLACAEARLGNPDSALGYLQQSVTLRSSLVDLARDDDDLSSLREDPRFEAAVTPG